MRFTSFIVAGAFAVAARAQTTTAPEPEETSGSPTVSLDPVQSSIIACLDSCDPDDVGCLARCNPVPNPNEDQALDTIDCVAQCEQGNGTEEETAAYIECSNRCVNEHFFSSGVGTPEPTGGNNENSNEPNSTASSDTAATTTAGSDEESSTTGSSSPEETSTNSEDSNETVTESGAETPTNSEGNPEETGADDDSGAVALAGSVLFGGLALVLAL